jgi:hypothetical protein
VRLLNAVVGPAVFVFFGEVEGGLEGGLVALQVAGRRVGHFLRMPVPS